MSSNIFPVLPGLDWNVVAAPEFTTQVRRAVSGRELRGSYMAYPLWNFSMKYEFLRGGGLGVELNKLAGLFLVSRGQWDNFLYTAPHDNAVTVEQFGVGNGSTSAFQLTRAFGYGGLKFVEPVMNLNSAPLIYVNGVLKTVTTDYTINSTGVVTFVTPPAGALALTWTGSYYYRCRFMMDTAQFSQFMQNLWELQKLELIGSLGNKI